MHNHPNYSSIFLILLVSTAPHTQHQSCSGCGTSIESSTKGLVFTCQHFSCPECSKSSPPICPACKDPKSSAVDITTPPDGLKELFESPLNVLKNAVEAFVFQSEHYRSSMICGWEVTGALRQEIAALRKELEIVKHSSAQNGQSGEDKRNETGSDSVTDQGQQSRVVRKLHNVFWKANKPNAFTLAQDEVPTAAIPQGGDDRPFSVISLASISTIIAPAVDRMDGIQSCSSRPSSMANDKVQTLDVAASKQRRRKRVKDNNIEVGRRQSLNLEGSMVQQQSRGRSSSFASTTASDSDPLLQLAQRPRTVSSPLPSRTMSRLSSGTVRSFRRPNLSLNESSTVLPQHHESHHLPLKDVSNSFQYSEPRTSNSMHTPISALSVGNENRVMKSKGLINKTGGIDGISRPTSHMLRQHSALPEHSHHVRLRSPQLPYHGDVSRGGISSRPTTASGLLSLSNIKRPRGIEEGDGGHHKPNALSQFVGGVSSRPVSRETTRNKPQPIVGIGIPQISTGQMDKPSYLNHLRSPTTPVAQTAHAVIGEESVGGGIWQKTRGGIPRRPDIQFTSTPSQPKTTGIGLWRPYSKP